MISLVSLALLGVRLYRAPTLEYLWIRLCFWSRGCPSGGHWGNVLYGMHDVPPIL
jgi:hypothetical protein